MSAKGNAVVAFELHVLRFQTNGSGIFRTPLGKSKVTVRNQEGQGDRHEDEEEQKDKDPNGEQETLEPWTFAGRKGFHERVLLHSL